MLHIATAHEFYYPNKQLKEDKKIIVERGQYLSLTQTVSGQVGAGSHRFPGAPIGLFGAVNLESSLKPCSDKGHQQGIHDCPEDA